MRKTHTGSAAQPAKPPAKKADKHADLSAPAVAVAPPPIVKVPEEEVRMLAYYKWEDAGKPEGADVWFWLEAERDLLRAHR
jgi:hypothetical protein